MVVRPRLECTEPETRGTPRVPFEKHCYEQATREEKSAKAQHLAKRDAISIGRKFAQSYGKARLLFDHPHSYREWNIVGQCDVPGFFYLESDSG